MASCKPYDFNLWLQNDPARFEAVGRAGQRITVIPQLNMVVVFTGGRFELADVGRFIAAPLRSDQPITEDPAGYSLLQAKVKPAARLRLQSRFPLSLVSLRESRGNATFWTRTTSISSRSVFPLWARIRAFSS